MAVLLHRASGQVAELDAAGFPAAVPDAVAGTAAVAPMADLDAPVAMPAPEIFHYMTGS